MLTVKSHVLSYHSPGVRVCPGRAEPTQARGFPCSVVSLCSATLVHPGIVCRPGEGDQLLFKTTCHPVRGSPACGVVTEGHRWSSACVQCAGCLPCAGCLQRRAAVCDELSLDSAQQGSPSRLLYFNQTSSGGLLLQASKLPQHGVILIELGPPRWCLEQVSNSCTRVSTGRAYAQQLL